MRTNRMVLHVLFTALIGGIASAQSGGNFVIKDTTIEGGGQTGVGGNFISEGRLGQALAGQPMAGGAFAVGGGIFPPPPPPPPVGPPSAPIELRAMSDSRSEILLIWTDTSDNEQGFLIERCDKAKMCSKFVEIGQAEAGATSFNDSGLARNTQYRYRVRAFNAGGNSAYSNVASAKTLRK
jgi:hypothetical protein